MEKQILNKNEYLVKCQQFRNDVASFVCKNFIYLFVFSYYVM